MDSSLDELLSHSKYSEYQVLYTLDVKKRAKVWYDGTLRLFKINRKLILYNESKIVVYEDFMKKYEPYKEGKVLKFETVWITIDSLIGVYERNVLGQFYKFNAHDINAVAHLIATPTKKNTNIKSKSISAKKRRVVGLSRIHGSFRSPLLTRKKRKQVPVKNPLAISSNDSITTSEIAYASMSHESTGLHINRDYDTPALKELLTPPTSVSIHNTGTDIQTPLKMHDTHGDSPLCERMNMNQIDVYNSDSQENEELSELEGDDNEDKENKSQHNIQMRLFRKLELGAKAEEDNNNNIATETWGNDGNRDKSRRILELSNKLITRSTIKDVH